MKFNSITSPKDSGTSNEESSRVYGPNSAGHDQKTATFHKTSSSHGRNSLTIIQEETTNEISQSGAASFNPENTLMTSAQNSLSGPAQEHQLVLPGELEEPGSEEPWSQGGASGQREGPLVREFD